MGAGIGRGANGGDSDNTAIVRETLQLRAEKARMLGYDTFAALKLDDTMAKNPTAVMGLLEPVWEKALAKAADDRDALQRIAAANGSNEPIVAADWRYWQEKLRAQKYAFDEAELKAVADEVTSSNDEDGIAVVLLFGLRMGPWAVSLLRWGRSGGV